MTARFRPILGILGLLGLGLLASCKSAGGQYDFKKEPDPRGQEFTVGPLDTLSVIVWKNKDMSADVTVRPDGVVTLPLIGDIRAANKTPSQLQKEISKALTGYMREEEVVVSVGVSSVNSYHFTVMGSVEHAGYYTSKTYVSAVEAIAMAGGPNRFAGSDLVIIRGNPPRKIPIDMRRASSSEYPEENLMVLRGDLLVVP